jgi:cyclic pyranopterin phosphate synthase
MGRLFAVTLLDPILGRRHRKLRISVTDRCAFRCSYCVPDDPPVPMERADLLSFEEILSFVRRAAVPNGLTHLRLTGGEPLQRRGLIELARGLSAIEGVASIGLTTNGERLEGQADALAEAGVSRLNLSLDTLRHDRFRALVQLDRLDAVLAGVDAGARAPFASRKLNCVPLRGLNEDELGALVRFGGDRGYEVRFIEFMPFGSRWTRDAVITTPEILSRLSGELGAPEALGQESGSTAARYRLDDGTVFGIIPTISQPFCGHCDRVRLTADGRLLPCLFSATGPSVRDALRSGASDEALGGLLGASLAKKGIGYLAKAHESLLAGRQEPPRHMKAIGG